MSELSNGFNSNYVYHWRLMKLNGVAILTQIIEWKIYEDVSCQDGKMAENYS